MGFTNSSESVNTVIVGGRVSAAGARMSGSGWSVAAPSDTSLFTITLDREYNGCIAAVATAEGLSGNVISCIDAVGSFPAGTGGAEVKFQGYQASSGTNAASQFSFILILEEGDG